jgi:hypothetical protein
MYRHFEREAASRPPKLLEREEASRPPKLLELEEG